MKADYDMDSLEASLPSRERGLKYFEMAPCEPEALSLPSRERGLKSGKMRIGSLRENVAPFAGAWIEMK